MCATSHGSLVNVGPIYKLSNFSGATIQTLQHHCVIVDDLCLCIKDYIRYQKEAKYNKYNVYPNHYKIYSLALPVQSLDEV